MGWSVAAGKQAERLLPSWREGPALEERHPDHNDDDDPDDVDDDDD